ncbi:hypothetical protein [Flavobacterium johnsoniae]|uniref:Uncharacterized protein n=1 Tax=Flavobacterium johnsoniae TaxID=986 RepID=A0A1M5GFL8_FLAJO|nr:hypothetical protein [Flavobacterium johnsoniae]SHG02524.1 hypothetical protein SAMN05444388_101392 [Flavobacterium johnsoniae]
MPVWYGGGIGNNRNAFDGVGHLSCAGFLFPKRQIMSTNVLSKETELKLNDFFNNYIDPKLMAKTIRKVNYVLALSLMRDCETMEIEKTSIQDAFYWLNELAEILNPYLDVE